MDRRTWATRLLTAGGFPVTGENVTAIVAWATAEGASAWWNPLATTMPAPGATNYNDVGVRNYTKFEDGLAATLDTLAVDGYGYTAIRAALTHDAGADVVAVAVDASSWGTHGVPAVVQRLRTDHTPFDVTVAGPEQDGSSPTAPHPQEESPMFAPTDKVRRVAGPNPSTSLVLHADGNVDFHGFPMDQPGWLPTYTVMDTAGETYTFPDPRFEGVISYPGLPDDVRNDPARLFTDIWLGTAE